MTKEKRRSGSVIHFILLLLQFDPTKASRERPPDQAVPRQDSRSFVQLSFSFGCNCYLDLIALRESDFVAVFVGQRIFNAKFSIPGFAFDRNLGSLPQARSMELDDFVNGAGDDGLRFFGDSCPV
jgi:hypothetical protein